MRGANPLFQAHMLLLRWGEERLARQTGDADSLVGTAATPAGDENDVCRFPQRQHSTAGAADKRWPYAEMRAPRDQARYLLRCELVRRGLLEDAVEQGCGLLQVDVKPAQSEAVAK